MHDTQVGIRIESPSRSRPPGSEVPAQSPLSERPLPVNPTSRSQNKANDAVPVTIISTERSESGVTDEIEQKTEHFEADNRHPPPGQNRSSRLAEQDKIRPKIPQNIPDTSTAVKPPPESDQEMTRLRREITRLNREIRQSKGNYAQLHSVWENQERDKDAQIDRVRYLEQQLAASHQEAAKIRQEFRQMQNEYGWLRSQVQVQDNTEQSEIVQVLKDLNRDIDTIGRSISEHFVDIYVPHVFGGDAAAVTALDACDLPGLKSLLGHVEKRSSLIASSKGVGMPIEDFIDYAIRMFLCAHLHEHIFRPFHPGANKTQNEVVAAIYRDIKKREPPAVSAQWRANCFKSIHKTEDLNAAAPHINLLQQFDHNYLLPLFTCVFGTKFRLELRVRDHDRLKNLLGTAWRWNSVLKGDVVLLGDFQLVYRIPTEPFDSLFMNELEPDQRGPAPRHILGTIGLGLVSVRDMSNPEVVLKTTVATNNLYARIQ